MQVAELYRGTAGFDVLALVTQLADEESVPYLLRMRYKETGLNKRILWERTWDTAAARRRNRRAHQAAERPTRTISIPTRRLPSSARRSAISRCHRWKNRGLTRGDYWRMRGALDVPKERFVSYPGCERRTDDSLVLGWAGWNHLQQAQGYRGVLCRERATSRDGRTKSSRRSLMACSNCCRGSSNGITRSNKYNQRMGDFFEILYRPGVTSL